MLPDDTYGMLDDSAADISKSKEDLRQASFALARAYQACSRLLLESADISITDARIALEEYEAAWRNLLESTGERPDSKPSRNCRLQLTFRGLMQCLLLAFFLFVIGCIAVRIFHDLILKEWVEVGKRDNTYMGLSAK